MALPTISYGVGWQIDCDDKSDFETAGAAPPTLTVDSNTLFDLTRAGGDGYAANKSTAKLNISSTTYAKVVFRYKTSNSSIKTRLQIVFSDATNEYLTGEISSTSWVVGTATIATSGKTIDYVRMWCMTSAGNVYYDFITFYTGTQTFHNYDTLDVNPRLKAPILAIPGSDTDVTQLLGRANTLITIEGPMRTGKTWGGSHLTYGEFLMQLLSERKFQWFTSDLGNFKVVPVPEGFHFTQDKSLDYQRRYVLALQEYDVGDASVFSSPGWFGK